MPQRGSGSSPHRRGILVLRGVGFGAAVVLGGVAIWLIVTSTSTEQKRTEIGILLGLWGLLLGAFSVFGSRSSHGEAPPPSAAPAEPGTQLDLRQIGEIERAAIVNAVAAARREFQAELEHMLRREVQAGLAQEVAGLRAEVSALRNDLVEKVGGQLRLERIETTRLIGSDLEALQQELRQLREIGGSLGMETAPGEQTKAEVHDAEIVVERVVPPQPVVVARPAEPTPTPTPTPKQAQPPPEPEPEPEPEPVAQPPEPEPEPVAQQPEPEPEPVARQPESEPEPEPVAQQREPEPEPARTSSDPFASMPRIRPFTDFELDPVPTPRNGDAETGDRAGRHATGDEEPAGGRRHRSDDDGNDVLARILARESRH